MPTTKDDALAVTKDIRIPIADVRQIYEVSDVERALDEQAAGRNDALAALYEKMKKLGGERYLIKPSSPDALDSLYDDCPNFTEVIDDLKKSLALALSGNEPINFTPLLLLGEPGVGKTHFAKRLADVLGTGHEFVSMSSLTAGWILSGASSQWTGAKAGKVASTLIHGGYANPLMVLDEVDKAGGDARYDPMGALYGLLEHETAQKFKDEFIELDIDASHLLWVATANDERSLPEPILNRMNVYAVPRPDHEQAQNIATRLYHQMLAEHHWGFAPEPPPEVLDRLAGLPPRDMKKRLLAAFGSAKLAGRDTLYASDLDMARAAQGKRGMGF
jgi:ATP-dependent Lon protease